MPLASPTTIEDALVLAGGLATRLGAAAATTPKALLPVAGRPFLHLLLDQLAAAGIRRAILCTGHLADAVEATLGQRYGAGLELVHSRETQPLGTAGALRLALPHLLGHAALVANGDSYLAADLRPFLAWWAARRPEGALLLAHVADTARYGAVECAADGRITAFAEKAAVGGAGWINAGVYVLGRALLAQIPAGRPVSLEREMFPAWAAEGRLLGYAVERPFIDIGTPEALAAAESFLHAASGSGR